MWRIPDDDCTGTFSARQIDPESASEGEGDLDGEEEMSDDEYLRDDTDGDEMDVEPWQHGMSAMDALAEEFEREVARAGMYCSRRR